MLRMYERLDQIVKIIIHSNSHTAQSLALLVRLSSIRYEHRTTSLNDRVVVVGVLLAMNHEPIDC